MEIAVMNITTAVIVVVMIAVVLAAFHVRLVHSVKKKTNNTDLLRA